MNSAHARSIVEAALMCSPQPLSAKDLYMMFDQGVVWISIKAMLADLQKAGMVAALNWWR